MTFVPAGNPPKADPEHEALANRIRESEWAVRALHKRVLKLEQFAAENQKNWSDLGQG